jgi:HD-like signal output (HDOD) protein/DNA-binding NarL/FixJ family response regulator
VHDILVVSDKAILREPLELALRAAGYGTASASCAAAALAAARERTPHLVLLDMNIPHEGAEVFLQRLRESPGLDRVPVVVLDDVADKARVLRTVQFKISGYIIKSQFSMSGLLDKIASTLHPSAAPEKGTGCAPAAPQGRPPTQIPQASATPPDPAARLRSLSPIMNQKQVLERVQACEQLKALSPTVAHVLKITGNDRCSFDAVAKAIGQDHAIALKVLKLGNSAVYTRGEPVDTVQKAIVRIGMERIRQTVLNISVVERFSVAGPGNAIDTYQFWEHGIATGIIAAELAHAQASSEADMAFTMGLLHDVGRIIYAEQLGEVYGRVVATARELELPLEQVETRMLVMNHADVMEQLLRAWKFAKDLISPIVFHHLSADGIRAQVPAHVGETARLALANRLAHALLLGSSGNEFVYPIEDLCIALKLDPAVLNRITTTAREQTDSIKFAMLSAGNAGLWAARRDVIRERFKRPFRPLFVSPRPERDAFRILCSELSGAFEEPCTVAVVHIPNAMDSAAARRMLDEAEQRLHLGPLPAVVLSPGGRSGLDGVGRSERPSVNIPTPTFLPRMIGAVNELLAAAGGP